MGADPAGLRDQLQARQLFDQLAADVGAFADQHDDVGVAQAHADADLFAQFHGRLFDARAPERFRGEVEPIDRVAGHVPGAVNRPYVANLETDGRLRPREQLAEEFRALLGDTRASDAVLMCGSGVTACHNLLAMEHAGIHGARVYAGSWSEWISDPSRPVARG